MKKKSLFSGISAKLALVAVALTTVVVTSCEKEEFNIEPVELLPASATVTATVFDIETGQVLNATCTPGATVTIEAGSDGTIAQQSVEITASLQPNYIDNAGSAAVPALKKGQSAYIPLTIFLQPVSSAVEDFTMAPDPEATVIPTEEEATAIRLENKEDKDKTMPYVYQATVGQQVLNLSEIEKKIDALQEASSKAATDLTMDQVKAALKAQLAIYNQGFSSVDANGKTVVPATSIVMVSPVTSYLETEYTMVAKVNGKTWAIDGVKVKKAVGTIATPGEPEYIGHGHSHGHGHGNGGNSGGGEGGK